MYTGDASAIQVSAILVSAILVSAILVKSGNLIRTAQQAVAKHRIEGNRLLACIVHELPTAVADSSENTGRAPSACSTCCQARLRALKSTPPRVFTTLDALATLLHE